MSTSEKGDQLEDKLHDYLCDQVARDELVFGAYPAELCEVHKKKKYFCRDRGADVEFDIVIEIRRKDSIQPHLFVLFECKNHRSAIQERDVTDFSDKVGRIFGHSAKALLVFSSRLQSGAEAIARSRRIGIIKFDESGMDIIADRTGATCAESGFLNSQIFNSARRTTSLKFSAYYDGEFFGSVLEMLRGLELLTVGDGASSRQVKPVPFVPISEIQKAAQETLELIHYTGAGVDLTTLCAELSLGLTFSRQTVTDPDGNTILGSANFHNRLIEIHLHGNQNRERFTIGHEIGHFCLSHGRYFLSESVVEHDLFVDAEAEVTLNVERLEYQANIFASELLLPDRQFRGLVEALRRHLGIYDKGFGYLFVDDQPCNYLPYNQLTSTLSGHFGVSRRAVEVRLKRMGLLTDQRKIS